MPKSPPRYIPRSLEFGAFAAKGWEEWVEWVEWVGWVDGRCGPPEFRGVGS